MALGLGLTLFVLLAAIQTSIEANIARTVPLRAPAPPALSVPATAAATAATVTVTVKAITVLQPVAIDIALGDRWEALVRQLTASGLAALVRELAAQAGLQRIDASTTPPTWHLLVERDTLRTAALADKLHNVGVALSGLILVSCAIDLQTLVFAPANDLPFALFLPAFANVAQYHGLLAGPLGQSPLAARSAAEAFVQEDYVAALHAGARLSTAQRGRIARRLSELTGLPQALVEEKNLRINDQTFFFEALRSRGRMVGRLDARATGPMAASRSREWEFDPGIESIAAPYATAAMAYFGEQLGLDMEHRYQVLAGDVTSGWNWNRGTDQGNGYACTSPDLARALRRNPQLKVLVASGRYDLGTPYSASDWSLAQLDVPQDVLARVTHRYYDAGHMMYTRQADLVQLHADLAAWRH